jgi:hypothetical protein
MADASGGNTGTLVNGPTWTAGHLDGALVIQGAIVAMVKVRIGSPLKLELPALEGTTVSNLS